MKKKQPKHNKQHHQDKNKQDDSLKLGDRINGDIMAQLREKQKQLSEAEAAKKEAEETRKKEARRQKEKNKSFEELFNESGMDWKNFK
ncbi:DUF3886 domain-containing protein [Peribacillus cavernae]|uniref:DUF3886 domain-containing protein n=1 Tax=Peribacillus cavernae TaxID=1674310 RepID=A0A3S0TX85_9BACI|nr:YqkE family protein [Peribacillus cavernae]MDQ0219071.1 queuine/archaeosine tRNA-ribosyltransferase [Peribacillus cavernae]RUQ26523.1 DUF3886 domain-containing protein [Peribacillus cavernae]